MQLPDPNQRNRKPRSPVWLTVVIVIAIAIDYATIMRVEIFDEVKSGKSFLQAVNEGDLVLTAIGITISVVGVAWIFYLWVNPKRRVSDD